jgi:hypothetical protein
MKKALIVLLALAFPMSVFAMDIPQGKYEITGTPRSASPRLGRHRRGVDTDTIE